MRNLNPRKMRRNLNHKRHSNPVSKILFMYLILFFIGGVVLHSNILINDGYSVSWIDSFFTSASSFATTGLSLFDPFEVYNFFGLVVMIIIFNIGGMGIMVLNTMIFIIIGKRIGIKNRFLAQIDLNNSNNKNVVRLIRTIIISFLVIELLGAFLIFLEIGYQDYTFAERIMNSLFMASTAISGSGFYNTVPYINDYFVLTILSFLMVFGFIGWPVIVDVIEYVKHKRSKSLKKYHFSHFTKLVVKVNIITVLIFVAIFLILENHNILDGYNIFQKVYYSLYTSISTKSVGLSVFSDFRQLMPLTLMFSTVFMIIGGSPSSACGGIRVTTVYIIYKYTLSQFRGQNKTRIDNYYVSQETVLKSFFITFLFLLVSVLGFLFINITNNIDSSLYLWYDVVSAITTTGFTAGTIPLMNNIGILTLTLLMVIGRIGIANLISGLHFTKSTNKRVKYPKKDVII